MIQNAFSHIETWIFDLDQTLYPPEVGLFTQIEARMTGFMTRELGIAEDAANRLRKRYWAEHGTTLSGLMHHHDIAPEPFLEEVHDISFDVLSPNPDLAVAIKALPGRRIVYTNGDRPYAMRVLGALGLTQAFAAVYGIEHAGYHPKPEAAAFERVFAQDGLLPDRAAMFEDDPRNLAVPRQMGLRTIHVAPEPDHAPHVEYHTNDLTGFLLRLTG